MKPLLPVFPLEFFIMNNLEFVTGTRTPEEPGYAQVLDFLTIRRLLCVVLVRLLAYRIVN